MQRKILGVAAATLIGSVSIASANVVAVDCVDDKVVISMAEDIAMAAQERAGSEAEFKKNVCTTAQQLPLDTYDRPTRVQILIEPYGIETAVVVFPTSKRDQGN
jgi:hypothetical protein